MIEWAWIDLVDEEPLKADLRARVAEGGWLGAWMRRAKPARSALRADARIFDPDGRPATVSYVRAPAGVTVLFDDPAVQEARRRLLAGPYPDALSTLMSNDSRFEGAVSVIRTRRPYEDPFARVFPARVLNVGAGLFGATAPPAGPTIERYGSARPWPWDRF
jgi:hypothetical protein